MCSNIVSVHVGLRSFKGCKRRIGARLGAADRVVIAMVCAIRI